MADFFFTSSSVSPRKLEQIYSETDTLKDNMRVYRNYTSEVYEYENNSAYIIGTSQVIEKDKETFIKNILAKDLIFLPISLFVIPSIAKVF